MAPDISEVRALLARHLPLRGLRQELRLLRGAAALLRRETRPQELKADFVRGEIVEEVLKKSLSQQVNALLEPAGA